MQFLFEEFFSKTFKFINSINLIIIRILIKLIFYIAIGGIIILFIYWFYTKDYIFILIILGLFILAEIAHYIRKSREKVMLGIITSKNKLKEDDERKNVKRLLNHSNIKNNNLLNAGKIKNKTLLKANKVQNKNLLNINKIKNKTLLKHFKTENKDVSKIKK